MPEATLHFIPYTYSIKNASRYCFIFLSFILFSSLVRELRHQGHGLNLFLHITCGLVDMIDIQHLHRIRGELLTEVVYSDNSVLNISSKN